MRLCKKREKEGEPTELKKRSLHKYTIMHYKKVFNYFIILNNVLQNIFNNSSIFTKKVLIKKENKEKIVSLWSTIMKKVQI